MWKALAAVLLLVAVAHAGAAPPAAQDEEFVRVAEGLQRFLTDSALAAAHVGVGFDAERAVVRRDSALFAPATDLYEIDPFMNDVEVEVYRVNTARELHEAYARIYGVPFVPGMFAKAPLPFYPPDDDAHPAGDYSTYLSLRSEELLSIRLKAAAQLDPALNAAFAALPAHFDARDWPQWQHFFARYPAHYTDAAYAGGRVTLSSVTRLALPQVAALSERDVRRALERVMRDPATLSDISREISPPFGGIAAGKDDGPGGAAAVRRATWARASGTGGDAALLLARDGYSAWLRSVQRRPAIIRYNVREISELAGTRRAAVAGAVAHLFGRAVTGPAPTLALSHEARVAMAEEVKGLQGQRAQLLVGLGQLQKRLSMLGDCQARVATKRATLERCTGEKAAFQSSLVRCENRFLILETMEDRLRECELDTLACAKRKAAGGAKKVVASEAPRATAAPREASKPQPSEQHEAAPAPTPRSTTVWWIKWLGVAVVLAIGLALLRVMTAN